MTPTFRRFATWVAPALLLLGQAALGQTIPNPGFEANTFTVAPGAVSDNGPITGWTATPELSVGLNPAGGTSQFADNGAIPGGANVAYIQSGFSTLSTTISGLTVGTTYRVGFRANAPSNQVPYLTVYLDGVQAFPAASPLALYHVGGSNPYAHLAFEFIAAAAEQVMALVNEDNAESAILVDDFTIAPSGGTWTVDAWSDDATSGVDANYVYTHAYSFGSGANTTINTIPFTGVAGGFPAVADSFTTTFLGNVFNNDGNNIVEGSRTLANDFVYGGTVAAGNYQSITMLGLTPGTEYVVTLYTVGFEGPSATIRWATFSVGDDRLTINQDQLDNDNGLRISCRYTADASGTATLRFAPVNPANMSIHSYGFSNREATSRNVPPAIVAHPASTTVAGGVAVTFSVAATAIPAPTYQWRRNGSNLTGATEATYTIPAATEADAGTYDVVVANTMGSLTSNPARLIVGLPMTNPSFEVDIFTVFPGYVTGNGPITGWASLDNHGINPGGGSPFADNGSIPHGIQVAFMQGDGALSQTVSGFTVGNQYYLHYYENARGGNLTLIEAKLGTTTLVPTHAVTSVGGSNPYREVFSDVFTATTTEDLLAFVKSNPAGGDNTALIDNVAFVPVPAGTALTITRQPISTIASVGDTVTFSAQAIGSQPITFQWLKDGTAITGETGATLTLTGIQKPAEGDYTVTASNSAGSAPSAIAHLTVFEPIPDLYSTGLDANRAPLASGSADPHYQLITNPDPESTGAVVEDTTVFPIVGGPWLLDSPTSKWIGPRLNTVASPVGVFVYRTSFNLVDRDPSTVIILGQWSTDNAGTDILVNGVSTANPQNTGFNVFTPFRIDAANATLVAGVNTIDFVVENQVDPGYTGLRVEILRSNVKIPAGVAPEITANPTGATIAIGDSVTFTGAAKGTSPLSYQWNKNGTPIAGQTGLSLTINAATVADAGLYTLTVSNSAGTATSTGAQLNVSYSVLPNVFGTGVAADGTLAPGETVDPHYTLTLSADEFFPGPDAIVLNDAWPIGTWLSHGPKSKWISVQGSQAVGNAPGDYTYRTTFNLTGIDPSLVRLEGGWAVDNSGLDILVNGVSTGLSMAGFGGLVPFTITSGFVAGDNTVDFMINNAGDAAGPVGLRVDLRGLVTLAQPPRLQVTRNGENLSISWSPADAGLVLQSATDVNGTWSNVTGASNPYATTAAGARMFFQVIKPGN